MPTETGPTGVTQQDIDAQIEALLVDAADGEELDPTTAGFIGLAVRAAATAMDVTGTRTAMREVIELGASPEAVHECIELVAGLGVHSFFEATRTLDEIVGEQPADRTSDPNRQHLWDRFVGDVGYWSTMDEEIPGFLEALNRWSPAAFEAFFEFCAVPWRSGHLPNLTKELISAATDATPSHRYLPGMRLHVRHALRLGAGRREIRATIAIAAAGPRPHGVA